MNSDTAETVHHAVVKSFKADHGSIEVWDNGLVFYNINPNTEITLDIAVWNFNVLKEIYNGSDKLLVLVEPGKFTTLTKEARDFSARPETNAMTGAMAVIIHSLAQRLILNFHSKFISRQKVKVKAFNAVKEGVEWLLRQGK